VRDFSDGGVSRWAHSGYLPLDGSSTTGYIHLKSPSWKGAMIVSCANCKSSDLRKLKRNSFLKEPGYVCNSCGLKMRGINTKGTLSAYVGFGLVIAVTGMFFGWAGVLIGLVMVVYGAIKLREQEPSIAAGSGSLT